MCRMRLPMPCGGISASLWAADTGRYEVAARPARAFRCSRRVVMEAPWAHHLVGDLVEKAMRAFLFILALAAAPAVAQKPDDILSAVVAVQAKALPNARSS